RRHCRYLATNHPRAQGLPGQRSCPWQCKPAPACFLAAGQGRAAVDARARGDGRRRAALHPLANLLPVKVNSHDAGAMVLLVSHRFLRRSRVRFPLSLDRLKDFPGKVSSLDKAGGYSLSALLWPPVLLSNTAGNKSSNKSFRLL